MKMNCFQDYRVDHIEKHMQVLKNLFENIQVQAKANISKKQIKQKRIQNKRIPITSDPLEIGQRVTIKSKKIQGKLTPKYLGNYQVSSKATSGNYYLTNDNGTQKSTTTRETKTRN